MLNQFIKNEKGSSAVEVAVILIPILMLMFIFILHFNKTTLETETAYALKEGVRAGATQGTYLEAKAKAMDTFNSVLALDTTSKTALRDRNLGGTSNAYFKIFDLNHHEITGVNSWCRDYTFQMTVKVEKPSPIITQNTLLDEFGVNGDDIRRTIDTSLMLDKRIETKIENAPVCE